MSRTDPVRPDRIFADPRLAAVYDDLDADRSDLDAYIAMVEEFGARSVLDIGCGTGTLACLLAARGVDVIALDPARASLDVARRKPCAERVEWVEGDVTALPPLAVDLVVMTGNVAQVFVTDSAWAAALQASRRSLRPGGRLVFEVRDPAARAWDGWRSDRTCRRVELEGGTVETSTEVTRVALPLVSFRSTFVFAGEAALVSDSTLRFRARQEIEESLTGAGFTVVGVRDAPDRPGLEMVFIATKT